MKHSKNLLIVIPVLRSGGAEKIAVMQSQLFQRDYSVFIFTFHKNESNTLEKNIISLNWSYNIWSVIKSMLLGPVLLRKFCKKNNIDIVISHMERSNYIVALSRILPGYQYRHYAVVHNAKYIKLLRHRLLIKLLYNKINKIICVSRRIKHIIDKKYRLKNVINIYNPIDLVEIEKKRSIPLTVEESKLFDTKKISLINVGRLHIQKGQEFLIESFSIAVKKNNNLQLIILGDGPLRNKLETQVDNLNLNESIHFLGNQSNVFKYLNRADIFILSSLWEGFPGVLLEAMACKLPIISSDCDSGPREILAPQISVDAKLEYPYKTENGYIINDPYISKNNFIEDLANLLAENKPIKVDNSSPNIFDQISEENIYSKWKNILE